MEASFRIARAARRLPVRVCTHALSQKGAAVVVSSDIMPVNSRSNANWHAGGVYMRSITTVAHPGAAKAAATPHSHAQSAAHTSAVQNIDADVCIVGGGVVGAVLACRIAHMRACEGVRVCVLEAKPPPPLATYAPDMDPDMRVFALTPESQRILHRCGVWSDIQATRTRPYTHMQVWESLTRAYVRFHASDVSAAQLGCIAENRVLQSALYDHMRRHAEQSRFTLVEGAAIAAMDLPSEALVPALPSEARAGPQTAAQKDGMARIRLADGRTITTRLVVGADGAASRVRLAANIGTWGWDYDQRGLVATVRTTEPNDTAWQRFLPHGPVAVLPLWDNFSSIVWSTTPKHADELQKMSPQEFVRALNTVLRAPPEVFEAALNGEPACATDAGPSADASQHSTAEPFADRLYDANKDTLFLDPASMWKRMVDGLVSRAVDFSADRDPFVQPPIITEAVGPRASFPLKFTKANSYVAPRVALIGDAAHTVHPLAGQGLNLGIGDAEALAAAIRRAVEVGDDIGTSTALRDFERDRGAHNLAIMSGMDLIKRMFLSRVDGHYGLAPSVIVRPWISARALGIASIQNVTPVKSMLARIAMGGSA